MIRSAARRFAKLIAQELGKLHDDEPLGPNSLTRPCDPPEDGVTELTYPEWIRDRIVSGDIPADDPAQPMPGEAVPLTPEQREGLEKMRDRYAPDRQRQRRLAEQLENREHIGLDELRRRTGRDQ